MDKIFISYGSGIYIETLKRIGYEAKQLHIFDRIILYTPKDLPQYILSSPLMAIEKGGGMWLWKPYIIWKTLQDSEEGDIIVYSDAGSSLRISNEWDYYFNLIRQNDNIVFHYKNEFDYGWDQRFYCSSPKIKFWTKKSTLNYFDILFEDQSWREFNKLSAGFIISKGRNNRLIKDWLYVTVMFPDLVIDPFGNEILDQETFFKHHRHDQCILTPLAYYYAKIINILILPETSESEKMKAAVCADRIITIYKQRISFKTMLIRIFKKFLGENIYEYLHH